MKLLIQNAKNASITVQNTHVGAISEGLIVYMGIHHEDTPETIERLLQQLLQKRIIPNSDNTKTFDVSIKESSTDLLVVSQFTLYGTLTKGRRPSFDEAARPDKAKQLYDHAIKFLKEYHTGAIETGEFQAMMEVTYTNSGPISFILES